MTPSSDSSATATNILACDIAFKNPLEKAGLAVIVKKFDGDKECITKKIRCTSAKEGEIQAILEACCWIQNHDQSAAIIQSDSLEAIQDINKDKEIGWEVRPLLMKAKRSLKNLKNVTLIHVRRDANKEADQLAKLTRDAGTPEEQHFNFNVFCDSVPNMRDGIG